VERPARELTGSDEIRLQAFCENNQNRSDEDTTFKQESSINESRVFSLIEFGLQSIAALKKQIWRCNMKASSSASQLTFQQKAAALIIVGLLSLFSVLAFAPQAHADDLDTGYMFYLKSKGPTEPAGGIRAPRAALTFISWSIAEIIAACTLMALWTERVAAPRTAWSARPGLTAMVNTASTTRFAMRTWATQTITMHA
jgi:hypothetical protein